MVKVVRNINKMGPKLKGKVEIKKSIGPTIIKRDIVIEEEIPQPVEFIDDLDENEGEEVVDTNNNNEEDIALTFINDDNEEYN